MAYYKTLGIVLRRMNLGEADRILTVLTREHGKVRAVAKGVRRIKSRLAGHLEPFGIVELMFATGRNLDVVTSARLVRSGDAVASSSSSLAYGFLLAEMLDKLIEEGVEQRALYEVVEACYQDLSQSGGDAIVELYFKLRLLEALGYRPRLEGCSICGEGGLQASYFFVPEVGGIVDAACTSQRQYPLESNQIKLWRLIMDNPLAQVRRLGGVLGLAEASLESCNYFYYYTFGKSFRSGQALFE